MSEGKYIGITIGPIYDTIKKAQKTREIWGASYMFSYICKEILKKVNPENYEILLPDTTYVSKTYPGVGLYPDRILLKTKDQGNFIEINDLIKKVKESVAKKLWDELNKKPFSFSPYDEHIKYFGNNEKELKAFFYDYFKVYTIEADDRHLCFINKENKNIGTVKSLNLYLDNAEQMPTLAHFDPDPFYVLLHFINHSFLITDAFHNDYSKGFPSLTEIATNELQFVKNEKNEFIAQTEIRSILKRELEDSKAERVGEPVYKYDDGALSKIFDIEPLKMHLRTYHKYIAIVHADGDNMGELIGSLLKDDDVQIFSKDLVEFAVQANEILAGKRFTHNSQTNWGYGAAPIYIGGDDLVFFAPVASINEEGDFTTIFDLINSIDNCFNDIFNKPAKVDACGRILEYEKYKSITENRPCLTYGVSITFYKFPLREAFEISKQLMYDVKNDDYKTRNRIHFVLQKHSKQNYFGIIDKNFETIFDKYIELLKSTTAKALSGEKSEKFLNSIFKNILTNKGQYMDKNMPDLEELFKNNFNEKVHKEFAPYLTEVRMWIQEMLEKQDYKKGSTFEEDTLETIVSLLKFIHFIRDNEFRN